MKLRVAALEPLPGPIRRQALVRGLGLGLGALCPTLGWPLPSGGPTAGAEAEAKLLRIYQLSSEARIREALALADELVREHPNFHLAHLARAELLNARGRRLQAPGEPSEAVPKEGYSSLRELREESQLRIQANRFRPPTGFIPAEFLSLSSLNQHAIAVDGQKARLYLFENTATGLRLKADFYVSVGKSGIDKSIEGDQRTPLGVYFVTTTIDPKTLKDFYGSGALPINYPNAYDQRMGRTGSGIWLHGTPPGQFTRAPRASDGCLVLANPDLNFLARTVRSRTTPVLISKALQWVPPSTLREEGRRFEDVLHAWVRARQGGDLQQTLGFYTPDAKLHGLPVPEARGRLDLEIQRQKSRAVALKDLSYLRWKDEFDTMVVTFFEVINGQSASVARRQYWLRQAGHWKIMFDGVA